MRFPPDLPRNRRFDVVGLGGNAADHILTLPVHPAPGGKTKFSGYSRQGGGRTATAMVAVVRLGHTARYLGGVGDDSEGTANLAGLQDEGVDVSGVRVRPGALTQRAFILVHEPTGERTILWGRGPEIPLRAEEISDEEIACGRLFYTDAQDPRAAARAADPARAAGMPVLVDIEDVRPGMDLLLPKIDFLIVSASFPETATGSRNPAEATRILEERTEGGLVVVTRGAGGAVARIDGRLEEFPAYAVEARDTTGAGDVFHGAFAVACLRGLDLQDAIDFSNAAAAMKCRRIGGREGIPRSLEEIERFRRETPHRAKADAEGNRAP
ncbi:MAG: ribokinase [Candidatus Eisenbacteria bacterium]|nr:ribokinase [Candidatus Eisenbacteria bacterium]